jgi:hypothetical protein
VALHDIRYKHWDGPHRGIWRRRATIAAAGLGACLQNRWARYLVACCWLLALVQVSVLFCIGQLLVTDSVVVQWAAGLNPQLQTFVRGLTGWLEQHPEISVRVAQNLLFYRFASALVSPSLVAVALAIPHLITRDLGSNAIVVYASKAISRLDYLLGKAGAVLGLLALTWLGPVLAAWLVGNLLAPNWNFFWHSRVALGNVLLFVLPGMVFLAVLGLGVSALSSREKATVGLYVALWLVGNAFVPLGFISQSWLMQLSFHHDLQQYGLKVFRPQNDLKTAQDNVPILGEVIRQMNRRARNATRAVEPQTTWPALAAFALASAGIVAARTKPQ